MIDLSDYETTHDEVAEVERDRIIEIIEKFWEENKVKQIGEKKEYIPGDLKGIVSGGVKISKMQYKTFNKKTRDELISLIVNKAKWVVENVSPFYKPLIKVQECNRHLFWCNFPISKINLPAQKIDLVKKSDTLFGRNISEYDLDSEYGHVKVLRNQVNPRLGLHIFEMAFKKPQTTLSLKNQGEASHG